MKYQSGNRNKLLHQFLMWRASDNDGRITGIILLVPRTTHTSIQYGLVLGLGLHQSPLWHRGVPVLMLDLGEQQASHAHHTQGIALGGPAVLDLVPTRVAEGKCEPGGKLLPTLLFAGRPCFRQKKS